MVEKLREFFQVFNILKLKKKKMFSHIGHEYTICFLTEDVHLNVGTYLILPT